MFQRKRPSNPRPGEPPKAQKKTCDFCSEAFAMGYKKGFADAIKQYGIDKEDNPQRPK